MLIGEVARRSGVSARMLRHYESLGLVRPSGRTGSGYREYSGADIRRILHVESLRSLGLSLREIGRALDDPGFTPSALVGDLIRQTRARIAAQTELLTRLRRIDAADPADWEDALQVVALLHALGSRSADARQRAALSSADEVPVPVEALVEAVLNEPDTNVAGALRWSLARSAGGAEELLAQALDSPVAAVRERAARALAELPDEGAAGRLHEALGHPDAVVRAHAALSLATRGATGAVPVLIDMVVAGRRDTDAADALGALAADRTTADRITAAVTARITEPTTPAAARGRLTQALADVPGQAASRALAELARDEDRAVSLTAAYLLRLRGGTG
ncbi:MULTISPECIES: MerR family transcriptional regulator [Streptomyces diastaticus group]|uniref:MerR family transcriptional regulator n=1 Tax=Streptomyces diastaticus group TaxID=2849069 RepID=UPI0013CD1368|nr:MerR family transcriptional regulator [Streptomyces rutgersensis]WSU38665.1 MerR family transcriptional regulator [Streptomyces gougerotii]GFH66694.1 transcriptional regulator [Streptomyces rutgersensis]